MNIITYPFKAELYNLTTGDVINITKFIYSVRANLSMGAVYNTVTIQLKDIGVIDLNNSKINITYNDFIVNAYIVSISRRDNDLTEVYCRTIGAKLFKPFVKDINIYSEVSKISDLIENIKAETGVNIDYSSLVDIDIKGAVFKREAGDTLQEVANIYKADIVEADNSLKLLPKTIFKDIEPVAIIDDYIDNSFNSKTTTLTNGVGTVIISSDEDTHISTSIIADIYEDTGEVRLFTDSERMDKLEAGSIGLTKPFTDGIDTYSEIRFLNNNNYIELARYIDSITNIKLNNESIKYKIKGKIVEFEDNLRGVLSIEYKAKYKKTFLITKKVGNKTIADFSVTVDDDYLSWVGELSKSIDNGNLNYEIVGKPCTEKGFLIYIFNSDMPQLLFFKGAILLDSTNKYTVTDNQPFDKTETLKLTKDDNDNKYKATLKYPNATIKKVRIGGQEVSNYTTSTDNGHITIIFDSYYYEIEVLYTLNTHKINIQYTSNNTDKKIKEYLVLKGNNYDESIELNNSDECDNSDDCVYPKEWTFNIAKLLNLPLNEVVGKTITGLGTVDEFGEVKKTYTQDGLYTYDLSNIKPRTTLTFKANVNGSLSIKPKNFNNSTGG